MTVFTYSHARQHFSSVLEIASKEGGVLIKKRDGQMYKIRPDKKASSPFDVQGIKLNISAQEIVKTIRESRKR